MLRMPLEMTNDAKADVTDTWSEQVTAVDRARVCVKTEADVIKLWPVGWKRSALTGTCHLPAVLLPLPKV